MSGPAGTTPDLLTDDVHHLAETHGVSGVTRTPDGTIIDASHEDKSYALVGGRRRC